MKGILLHRDMPCFRMQKDTYQKKGMKKSGVMSWKSNSSHCMCLTTNDLHTNVTSCEFLKKNFMLLIGNLCGASGWIMPQGHCHYAFMTIWL